MKELGIQFSAPMVRAILDGRKTQTRRSLNPQPYISNRNPPNFRDTKPGDIFICPDPLPTSNIQNSVLVECESIGTYHYMGQESFAKKHCKYGPPGRRLWVREAFALPKEFDHLPPSECPHNLRFYRAECPDVPGARNPRIGKWRPGMFMPRCHSRIDLEVTEIRVERLQSISESDCLAEGIESIDGMFDIEIYAMAKRIGVSFEDSKPTYACLWESINGPGSWDANPFVWVISFKVIP